jgi:signal transduction histidine kinase
VTVLEHHGERLGALIHDPLVLADPALLGEVTAAARIALATVRLRAEASRHAAEIEASRRRIVEATDAERRRLQMLLRLRVGRHMSELGHFVERGYQNARASGDATVTAGLKAARDGFAAAEEDVTHLAAGIHPAVLIEHGIGPALSALVGRVGIYVRLTVPAHRLPGDVEAAVYFVCSEALTNVRKYAQASAGEVDVQVQDHSVIVVVADDGVGGADASSGSGLRGLRDRLEAMGGRLSIDSPPGRGTRIVAQIPLEPREATETPASAEADIGARDASTGRDARASR